MFKQFYPYEYAESVYAIDYQKLFDLGYRGIIFDIDNTLVPHGRDATPEVEALFREIQDLGFKTLLLSNNNQARVERFLENIDSLYICDAEKPAPAGFHRAVEKMELLPQQTVVIGDQVFTDIRGANRSGLASILVRFIGADQLKRIGKRRRAEQLLLCFYRRNRRCCHRIGDIFKKGDYVRNVVER